MTFKIHTSVDMLLQQNSSTQSHGPLAIESYSTGPKVNVMEPEGS